MHEVRLGYTVTDYLSGGDIPATTYEDLRQEMARFLVEDRGYPPQNLSAKVPVAFRIDNRDFSRHLDIVAFSDSGEPLLVLLFCAGEIVTYTRQCLAGARLHPYRPARLAAVTDTHRALIVQVNSGETLMEVPFPEFPDWRGLLELAAQSPRYEPTERKRAAERRILYAFTELGCSCDDDACGT
jgi:hypothetical protein